MSKTNELIDVLWRWTEERNSEDIYMFLKENKEFLSTYNDEVYRGYTCLEDTVKVGDILEANDYVMSWTKRMVVAKTFTNYNKDLLKMDDVALSNLGITSKDVDDKVFGLIFIWKNPRNILDVNKYTHGDDEFTNSHEEEVLMMTETRLVVTNVEKAELNRLYIVTVEELI